jgi:hypothetical protein
MKTRIHYIMQNNGDGSVSLELVESKELAEIIENHMDEGWGEPSYGYIDISHDTPINIMEEITTLDSLIKETEEELTENWRSDSSINCLKSKLEDLYKLRGELNG